MSGRTATDVTKYLFDGNPSIRVVLRGDVIAIYVHTVTPGDEVVIADRIREALGG